jgi:hypothetical protein
MEVAMSNAGVYELGAQKSSIPPSTGWAVGIVLLVWLALAVTLAAAGAFATPPGEPPLVLLTAVVGPVIAFLIGTGLSRWFREIVLAVDLPTISGIQGWRFAGFVFLALWAQGLLPGYFAWPAGAGDMAVAFAAPWMAVALVRRPGFAASRTFVAWNVLGILDLVLAVTLGALVPLVLGQAAGPVDTSIMTDLPLALIPAYLVPAFIILHLAALARARKLRRGQ